MVFQRPNPFPKSIFENVAYGLRVNGVKDREFICHRVEEALKGAALWNEVKHKLKESAYALSGGQQQRLCIARASQRPQDVEAVFGNLKNNKHFKRFHLRGLKKVEIEFGLLAIAHNLAKAAS